MALKLKGVLLGSEDPSQLVSFYQEVAQAEPAWTSKDGQFKMFDFDGNWVGIGPHDKVKGHSVGAERVMFNFETADVQAEYDRIKSAGATEVQAPYHPSGNPDMWLATLADPDGNYFQLSSPM